MFDISKIDPIIFQNNLRTMRELCNMSQKDLANYIGCNKQTIHNLETKKSPMRRYHAMAIFKIFEYLNPSQAVQFYTMCSHK